MNSIKTFSDASEIVFDNGKFDAWCVYIESHREPRRSPTDKQCFDTLHQLCAKYPATKLYQNFVSIYEETTKELDPIVLTHIEQIAENDLEIGKLYTTFYAMMVAEENKAYTRLGKRIKRLGVYQVLNENMLPALAAMYSRGLRWQVIDAECARRGF